MRQVRYCIKQQCVNVYPLRIERAIGYTIAIMIEATWRIKAT